MTGQGSPEKLAKNFTKHQASCTNIVSHMMKEQVGYIYPQPENAPIGPFFFKILTDEEVLGIASLGVTTPNSLNKFLGNTSRDTVQYVPDLDTYFSKRLQFNPVKYIFIKSANLGTFNTLGSFGERTVIKKVPVTAPQGEMILDDTRSGNDMLSCESKP